ncbi:MAG: 4a-hydroxytetrahydrobiopterin dehydratase [Gaiellaceae bacterium]
MADQKKLERLSEAQAAKLMASVPDWTLEGDAIARDFDLKDFRGSLAFVESVADIAEEQDHHPDIVISYNRVRLFLSTHKVGGLTEKDFALASAIDRLL